jgi:hypothetical protein
MKGLNDKVSNVFNIALQVFNDVKKNYFLLFIEF